MPVTRQDAEGVQQLVGELFIEIYTASPLQAIPIQASGLRAGISGEQVHVLVAFRIGGSEQAVEVTVAKPERIRTDPAGLERDIQTQIVQQLQRLAAALSGRPMPPEAGAPPPGPAAPDPAKELEKERAAAREADRLAQQQKAAAVAGSLEVHQDELGLLVAPRAKLSDSEALRPYIQARVDGDLPPGVPTQLAEGLQGKRIDVAVRLDFASEVLVEGKPLDRQQIAAADAIDLDGMQVRVVAVHAPRLAPGTLLALDKKLLFVSRRADQLPKAWLKALLANT
jgi:hypothetical protein